MQKKSTTRESNHLKPSFNQDSESKKNDNWTACENCQGTGKKRNKLKKKAKLNYQKELEQFEKTNNKRSPPLPPKGAWDTCKICKGTGLQSSNKTTIADKENYPHIAIIGAGIGGVALAVACLHRRIPFTLFERDASFDARSQGYGLTLQQASKAIQGLGISKLKSGIVSTRHVVHSANGAIIGEWGLRKWGRSEKKSPPKRTNIHITRQALRLELLNQLGNSDVVKWGYQLLNYSKTDENDILLNFRVNGEIKTTKADLIVGADGIRSTVRSLLIGEEKSPLQYLGCIVILGICPLKKLKGVDSNLLDSKTVFQTANGHERIYMMPFDSKSIMWQLSFPLSEKEAIELSGQGKKALKKEACRRINWHTPIPQILEKTDESLITGYPVYDRNLLNIDMLKKENYTTLIGDAAHPMSPFKGQGANQAILDALSLSRTIAKNCNSTSNWKESGILKGMLAEFEQEMIQRSTSKVKDSADAAKLLHSESALTKGNHTRGAFENT